MRQGISSDLPTLERDSSGNIDGYSAVGIAISVYTAHWQYESWQVQTWIQRIMPFFKHQQWRLFITDDDTPYGLVTWLLLDEQQHQSILSQGNWNTLEQVMSNGDVWSNKGNNQHLWLIDFVTPFSHALKATNELKEQFPNHQQAWALNQNTEQTIPRQIW